MDAPKAYRKHECCPKDWRNTPDFTGSYELDGVIHRSRNGDLPARMRLYADMSNHTDSRAYGPITGYNGYNNYSGDS